MTITHVRYREGQVLRTTDLIAEQHDRLEGWRRHLLGQHSWGVAFGLHLTIEGADLRSAAAVLVEPGLAVDGWGRTLVLITEQAIPVTRIHTVATDGKDDVAIWLRADLVAEGTGRVHARQERFLPCLSLSRVPKGGKRSDLRWPNVFQPPHLPLPDPIPPWPVYLGRVGWNGTTWEIDDSDPDVPYVEAVGWNVRSPNGDVEMRLGSERSGEVAPFAIATRDAAGNKTDRVIVQSSGRVRLAGSVLIKPEWGPDNQKPPLTSNLIIDHGGEDEPRGIEFRRPLPTPTSARPWQLYRTTVTEKNRTSNRLRLELPAPDEEGNEEAIQLAIGHDTGGSNNPDSFEPCLQVATNCAVRLPGALWVKGRVIQAPIPADPEDPRFIDALVDAQFNGWVNTIAALYQLDDDELTVEIAAIADPQPNEVSNYLVTIQGPLDVDLSDACVVVRIIIGSQVRPPAEQTRISGNEWQVTVSALPAGTHFTITVVVMALQPNGSLKFGEGLQSFDVSQPHID